MPAYYSGTLKQFASQPLSEIESILTEQNARAAFPLQPEAFLAWKSQLPPLQEAAFYLQRSFTDATSWTILLEYPIPRIGRRIDAVLIARGIIIVIEVKTGLSPTSALRQVDDYALSLACFHQESKDRVIVPLVISDAHVAAKTGSTSFDYLVAPCRFTTSAFSGAAIESIFRDFGHNRPTIDPTAWNDAQFKPIPPIIDAAVALYSNMNVFEIGHACAAREDLRTTTATIVAAVNRARQTNQKIICFVTGVPGAGKTLVGLNAVHEKDIRDVGSFLSGNGPLVKIIREALIRDVTKRTGETRKEADLKVKTFVQNVHRFADEYHGNAKVPTSQVVVFDEAQRAWDLAQSLSAGRQHSEPNMLLEIMDRHPDWAVIVALVGGGQEINRGEAGLGEWGKALQHFPHWYVVASPEVVGGGSSVAGFRLFEDDQLHRNLQTSPELHLTVAVRSVRSQQISDWVNAVLSGHPQTAKNIAAGMAEVPSLTRDLSAAKNWLRERMRGSLRAGLVGSSSANRLRVDGLEPSFDFHRRFEWENWFLDPIEDVRCSSRLEVFATQFEIQGLELDWIGVCWSEDFTWNGKAWSSNRFNNKTWAARRLRTPSDFQKHAYRINAYRVLLTRARQGMILYIPHPEQHDPTRMREELDETADYLLSCGVHEL